MEVDATHPVTCGNGKMLMAKAMLIHPLTCEGLMPIMLMALGMVMLMLIAMVMLMMLLVHGCKLPFTLKLELWQCYWQW